MEPLKYVFMHNNYTNKKCKVNFDILLENNFVCHVTVT